MRKFPVGRWAASLLITVLCFSFFQVRLASAATLDNAIALLFEKLNANISAVGEVVAILPEKNEVIIEFSGDLVPAYASELLVFGESTEALSEEAANTGENRSVMVYRGYVTVNESAGHVNRALIAEGRGQMVEGDQVFLPAPVVLYVTPVKNLTPYPYFTSQATLSISRLLGTFPGLQVFSLPGSNQKTVGFLQQKCRREGRYGLVLQPLVVLHNGRSKVQLKMTSLFSGQSIGVLAEEFKPFVAPQQNFRGYR